MKLIDTHCHLTFEQLACQIDEVVERSIAAGVTGWITVGTDSLQNRKAVELTGRFESVYAAVGVHPHEAKDFTAETIAELKELAANEKVVALGETGLDFYYDHSPRDLQESLFRDHLELACALDLPVVVHSREADALTGRILREWAGRVRGVLHCFTGGAGLLQTALELGWMVSFTGIITFKNYDGQDLVRSVPRDRLMVETDGPYLAPTPFRGRRNEPAHVVRVTEDLATIRGEDPQEVQGYTTENAIRFFGLRD